MFETIADVITTREVASTAVLATLMIFLYIESCQKRSSDRSMVRRSYFTNIITFVLNDTVMSLFSVSSLLLIAADYAHIGPLDFIPGPIGKVVVSFLFYDMTLYFWHKACHEKNSLWKFHRVHHSDLSVNATTAFRLHFVEVVFTTIVKASLILAVGMGPEYVLANEIMITSCVIFHHADITFRGERWLSKFIIVPKLHRVHHSVKQSDFDRNFGAVLTIWDRIFGTFARRQTQQVGLENVPDMGPLSLVLFGFNKK